MSRLGANFFKIESGLAALAGAGFGVRGTGYELRGTGYELRGQAGFS